MRFKEKICECFNNENFLKIFGEDLGHLSILYIYKELRTFLQNMKRSINSRNKQISSVYSKEGFYADEPAAAPAAAAAAAAGDDSSMDEISGPKLELFFSVITQMNDAHILNQFFYYIKNFIDRVTKKTLYGELLINLLKKDIIFEDKEGNVFVRVNGDIKPRHVDFGPDKIKFFLKLVRDMIICIKEYIIAEEKYLESDHELQHYHPLSPKNMGTDFDLNTVQSGPAFTQKATSPFTQKATSPFDLNTVQSGPAFTQQATLSFDLASLPPLSFDLASLPSSRVFFERAKQSKSIPKKSKRGSVHTKRVKKSKSIPKKSKRGSVHTKRVKKSKSIPKRKR
jgi:hypothetical protein